MLCNRREHGAKFRDCRLGAFVAAKRLGDRVCAFDDFRGVRGCGMALRDIVVVGSDVRLLELAYLELEEINLVLDGRAPFEGRDLARDLAPLVVGGGVFRKPDAAEAVERGALEIFFEYVLVRAGAMYVDETAAEFL